MKNLIYILALGLMVGCEIDRLDGSPLAHIFEDKELRGTIYLEDNCSESPTVIASEATVYLYEGDVTDNTYVKENYLLKTQADKNGRFVFPYQPKNAETLKIVAEYTDKNSILFRKAITIPEFNANNSLSLTPKYPKGNLKIQTLDKSKNIINGMNVYLFVNKAQAEVAQKSDPKAITTAIQTTSSNAGGIAFFYNLEDRSGSGTTYYLVGRKDADYTDVASVTITSNGASTTPSIFTTTTGPSSSTTAITCSAPLPLTLVTPSAPSQLTVLVNSNPSPPTSLSGIDVYLLPSLVDVNLNGLITTAVSTKKTNNNGQVEFNQVPAGTYFVVAQGTFPTSTTTVPTSITTVVRAGIAKTTNPNSSTISFPIPVYFASVQTTATPSSVTVTIDTR